MSILSQAIPLDSGTAYEDEMGQPRTEEEFFRTPGDVEIGDIVQVVDESAVDPRFLSEADEVELAD